MSTPIEENTTGLEEILRTVNALPNAGGGGVSVKRVIRNLTLEENADNVVINTDDNGNPYECHALLVITDTMNYEDATNTFVFIPNGLWAVATFANSGFPSTKLSAGYYQRNFFMSYAMPGDPYNVFAGFNIWQPYMPAGSYYSYTDRSTLANRASITSYRFSGKFAAGSKFTLIEVG